MRTPRSKSNDPETVSVLKELQRIPSIGPSLARDLYDLGLRRISDLKRKEPERLYQELIELRGVRQDPCVLYTFRCAVYFASEPNPEPAKLQWWAWQEPKPVKPAATQRTRTPRPGR